MNKERLIEILKRKVEKIESKEKVLQYINNLRKIINNEPEIADLLKQGGIELGDSELTQITREILNYYDSRKAMLNLDEVKQFSVNENNSNNEKYIQAKKSDDSFVVLDDNFNNKNITQQFLEKQNDSVDFQTSNGIQNRDEILNSMEREKQSATLTEAADINKNMLSDSERRVYDSMTTKFDTNNFIIDYELQYIIENNQQLTEEQMEMLNNTIAKKQELAKKNTLVKRLVKPDYNGFSNIYMLMLLCIIVGIVLIVGLFRF